jgi:CHAD domain-containing protein
MGSDHREIERKFETDERQAIADATTDSRIASALGSRSGPRQTHHLDATYYDTEQLRLASAGVSLRRRTGGDDAGWHLKLPREGDARDEIHRPLGRSTRPPVSLSRLLTGVTGGAPLAPVAVVRTTRTSWPLLDQEGTVLAIVSEDDVAAHSTDTPEQPLRWAEIEVELVEGGDDLLDHVEGVLTASGVKRSSSTSKIGRVLGERPQGPAPDPRSAAGTAHRYLHEHLDAFVRADLSVRTSDVSVHDLRVESRRLRTQLAVYRALFDESRARQLQQELRWVGRVLGDLRDLEVTHKRLRRALADDPATAATRTATTPARQLLRADVQAAQAAVRELLASERYAGLLDALQRFVADPPWTALSDRDAADVLPTLSSKPRKRLRKAAEKLRVPDHGDTERHDARKAARRLRYTMEVLGPIDRRANGVRKRARALQSTLGDYLDERRLEDVLWRLRSAPMSTRLAFTYGRLHSRSEAVAHAKLARAGRQLKKALKRANAYV